MKIKKKVLGNIIFVVAMIVILFVYFYEPSSEPANNNNTGNVAECIGQNSVVYVKLGCSACNIQEEMFGDDWQYMNTIDCFFERDMCGGISGTPTWVIDNQKYEEIQTIKKLRDLTGC